MSLLIFFLLAQSISPGDSCWKLVTLGDVPQRAVLFAESASRTGGQAGVDLAAMLEFSGRFNDALRCYDILQYTASDSLLSEWISGRISGCGSLDTLVILQAIVTNQSTADAFDVTVVIPRPESHPPYQTISPVAGSFIAGGDLLKYHIALLPGGATLRIPLVLQIHQEPYTFRPFSGETLGLSMTLPELAALVRSVEATDDAPENGPCLQVAEALQESALVHGLELRVVGGLFRTSGDSLLFHAWNLLSESGLPVDALLFQQDSLRGMGHCTTDLIPLWDYESTDGHEVSIFYPPQESSMMVSMDAVLISRDDIDWILEFLPCLRRSW